MWVGFAVAGGISLINGLSFLYPQIPRVPIKEANYDLGIFFTEEPWTISAFFNGRTIECNWRPPDAILSVPDWTLLSDSAESHFFDLVLLLIS